MLEEVLRQGPRNGYDPPPPSRSEDSPAAKCWRTRILTLSYVSGMTGRSEDMRQLYLGMLADSMRWTTKTMKRRTCIMSTSARATHADAIWESGWSCGRNAGHGGYSKYVGRAARGGGDFYLYFCVSGAYLAYIISLYSIAAAFV